VTFVVSVHAIGVADLPVALCRQINGETAGLYPRIGWRSIPTVMQSAHRVVRSG
jgi:hypothetical protein